MHDAVEDLRNGLEMVAGDVDHLGQKTERVEQHVGRLNERVVTLENGDTAAQIIWPARRGEITVQAHCLDSERRLITQRLEL